MANSPVELVDRARRFLLDGLWSEDPDARRLLTAARRALQLCLVIARGFIDDHLLLRASALTYMTALSIVPILVVVLSVIQWLGMSRDLAVLAVDRLLAGSPEAVDAIMSVVDSANVGALGTLGGGIFLVTTILSLRHVEETLNDIWGAGARRGWVQRFTNYLAVLIVVPLLFGAAISLGATLSSVVVVEEVRELPFYVQLDRALLDVAPHGFLMVSFALLYWVLPNTPVRLGSALFGAIVAALMFVAAQNAYVSFSIGVARYNAVFGGFAMLPLLLVWIYLSWSIVLLGAEIAYAHQNLARYRREARERNMGAAEREAVAVRVALLVAQSFRDRTPPPSAEQIADRLGSSLRTTSELLARLEGAGIVSCCVRDEGDRSFQLGRPAEDIAISDILLAVRGSRAAPPAEPDGEDSAIRREVESALRGVDAAQDPATSRPLAEILAKLPRTTA